MLNVILSLTSFFYRAFVLTIMWGWFGVPLGLLPISFLGMAGLIYIWGMFSMGVHTYYDAEKLTKMSEIDKIKMYFSLIIATTLMFGFSWLVHILQGATFNVSI